MKVRYLGNVSDSQVRWGSNHDPRGLLEEGKIYEVEKKEVHSYHTKLYLVEFPGKYFNNVNFEEVE